MPEIIINNLKLKKPKISMECDYGDLPAAVENDKEEEK